MIGIVPPSPEVVAERLTAALVQRSKIGQARDTHHDCHDGKYHDYHHTIVFIITIMAASAPFLTGPVLFLPAAATPHPPAPDQLHRPWPSGGDATGPLC